MTDYKPVSTLTKQRYYAVDKMVKEALGDDAKYEEFMIKFRDLFKFDPEKNSTVPKYAEKIKMKREQLKAEGISTYISSGGKKNYEKKKAQKEVGVKE
jgi:hypothetical protein